MPELRPDNSQVGIQGQIGQLTSPPPMPQQSTFVQSAETTDRAKLGAFGSQLGGVLANQAIERQKLINQAMISNALISAQSAIDDVYNQQIQRKGFNVMAQPATATSEAQNSIMDVFATASSEVVSSINPKLQNDFQREAFNRAFAPILIAKTDQLGNYYDNEIRSATKSSQNSNLQLMSNDIDGYINEGSYDKAEVVLSGAFQVIRSMNELDGGSKLDERKLRDNFINSTLPPIFASLNEQERYGEMTSLYERFGNMLTGQARLTVARMVGSGSLLGRAKDTATQIYNEHVNDPMFFNADGTINREYVYDIARNKTSSVVYVDYKTTSSSGAVSDQNTYFSAITAGIVGGENSHSYTEENRYSKAYGKYQIMPANYVAYGQRVGLTPEQARTPEGQEMVKNAMIQDAIDQGCSTPEEIFVWWLTGSADRAKEFSADPENAKFKTLASGDGSISLYDYVKRSMEGYQTYQATNPNQPKAPRTFDMPMQKIYDTNLQGTNAGLKSTLPYVGGMIADILGTTDGIMISGGARTKDQNASVNGVEGSYHMQGNAVDIVLPDSATSDQINQIKQTLKDTGMFDEVYYHDAGSGEHLHIAGYNGGLDKWLQNNGYSPSTVTSVQTTKYNVIDQRYQNAVISNLEQLANANDSQVGWHMNQLIGKYSALDWTSNLHGLEQALKGETINGRPLTQQQIAKIVSTVGSYNAGTTIRHDADVRFSDNQRQRTIRSQEKADRENSAMDMYYTDAMNGKINSWEELKKMPYFNNMPPQTRFAIQNAFKNDNAQEFSNLLNQGMEMAKARLKQNYGEVDPYVTISTQEYLSRYLNDYASRHGGRLPPYFILSQAVEQAITKSPTAQTDGDTFSDTYATDAVFQSGGKNGGISGGRITPNGRYWLDYYGKYTPLEWDEETIGSGWRVATEGD